MTRKQYYRWLCMKAEQMNEEFKSEGSSDRAIIFNFKIVILKVMKEKL